MKQLFIIFALVILSSIIYCQTAPDWMWVNQAGYTNWDEGRGIATDGSGNSYVAGSFVGDATFGTTLLSSNGPAIFIAKLDTNGNYLWAQQGDRGRHCYDIAIDSSGNSYVTGEFGGIATFGTTELTTSGENDIFIAKLDNNGNWLWAKKAGGTIYDRGYGIAIDSSGNSYVTGYFTDTATFGSTSLTTNSSTGIFIAKLDTNGNWQWAKQADGTGSVTGLGIASDSDGNSYVAGGFTSTATFGTTSLISNGSMDIFITKLDTNGNWEWAKHAGGTITDCSSDIAIDSSGNSYLTGYFAGTATFGTTTIISNGVNDIFVTKLDSNGNYLWVQPAGGASDDMGCGIAIDSSGNSYLTGYFAGTATFGTTTLTSSGSSDVFIAKLANSGVYLWAKQSGGTSYGYGYEIATDSNRNIYATGAFGGTATFGPTTIISSGDSDIFIAKLSSDGVFVTDEFIPETSGASYLRNAYPNPFHSDSYSIIKAEIPPLETGVFTIYNLRGQVVQSQKLSAGSHELSFSSKDLAPGIYFYRLKTTTVNEVKKLVLLR